MSTRLSVSAALAVALGFVVVGCANDQAPPPEKTFLTVSGSSNIAFAVGAGQLVEMVTTPNRQSSGGGGGGGFSASVAGGGSFSSSAAGAGSFTASTGGSSSFSSSLAGPGMFTGSSLLTPSCSLTELCDFAAAFCADFGGGNGCSQDIGQCYAYVNSSDFQSQVAQELAAGGVPAGFLCAILDFLECIAHSGAALDNISESVVLQCADASGLSGLISDLGQSNN